MLIGVDVASVGVGVYSGGVGGAGGAGGVASVGGGGDGVGVFSNYWYSASRSVRVYELGRACVVVLMPSY